MSLPRSAKAFIEQAEAEGLTLLTADNASGYKGVVVSSSKTKPYQAKLKRGGKSVSLGYYATAEEAAVCRAGLVKWGGVLGSITVRSVGLVPALKGG